MSSPRVGNPRVGVSASCPVTGSTTVVSVLVPLTEVSLLHHKGYSIIGSGSGFTVNLVSDSLVKSNDLGVSSVSRIHFGFGFIMNPDPDPIIE